ncbi:hypothetical protein AncyloWKF20_11255 [Ancylobacter sp. WKF20]|uniref:hypothetical protein n=1 Tax=Ancylobacter sp. WKF20 TaxID=3039801 RepID=UPI00243416AA|nr:hypothetical protein [Ancylobacter sp. WKF20]WGD28397.1 hypothetical protein AncyloWKF20_11255 [Ancylobacter sp. WKF20]
MTFQIPQRRSVLGSRLSTHRLCFATPALIGGALRDKPPSLGLVPLLAGLRFWWRAGVHRGAPASMRREEIRLFGGPAEDERPAKNERPADKGDADSRSRSADKGNIAEKASPTGGIGAFQPELDPLCFGPWTKDAKAESVVRANSALSDFLGSAMGGTSAKVFAFLEAGASGTLTLRERPRATTQADPTGQPEAPIEALDLALNLMTTFGGLGLLGRRGLGSINDAARTDLDINAFTTHVEKLIATVRERRRPSPPLSGTAAATPPPDPWRSLPTFATFSHATRCVVLDMTHTRTGLDALAELATAVGNFAKSPPVAFAPEHVFSAQSAITGKATRGRWPSQLHIHVQQLAAGYAIVLTHLPTAFPPLAKDGRAAHDAEIAKAEFDAATLRIETFLDQIPHAGLAGAVHPITVPRE